MSLYDDGNWLAEPSMQSYVCTVCGYVYNPEVGDPDANISPGTAFEDLPHEWICPVCGAGKDEFEPQSASGWGFYDCDRGDEIWGSG